LGASAEFKSDTEPYLCPQLVLVRNRHHGDSLRCDEGYCSAGRAIDTRGDGVHCIMRLIVFAVTKVTVRQVELSIPGVMGFIAL